LNNFNTYETYNTYANNLSYVYSEEYQDNIQNWLDVNIEDARNELGEDICCAVQDDIELF